MRGTALLERIWYGAHPLRWLLWPLSWLFVVLARGRRLAYRRGWLKSYRAPVPVLVVGNISVGGTGKTPLTIELCGLLRQQGWRPGIVSRGYGGTNETYPLEVRTDGNPQQSGDEPFLLARRCDCPVYVDPQRPRAVQRLLAREDVDIIISDDGLQHYALQRDIEIVVVDGKRRHGNGLCLPAGPLREGVGRLRQVDAILVNGPQDDEAGFELHPGGARRISDEQSVALESLVRPVHAVAGIGRPQRFFETLRGLGLEIIEHPFADHHAFVETDLDFGDELPVIMTEKDAVKCVSFARPQFLYLPVTAQLNDQGRQQLLDAIRQLPAQHSDQGTIDG